MDKNLERTCIIGSVEIPESLNELPELLENIPLTTRRSMWFQNDGCPAHYAREVRHYLDQAYTRDGSAALVQFYGRPGL